MSWITSKQQIEEKSRTSDRIQLMFIWITQSLIKQLSWAQISARKSSDITVLKGKYVIQTFVGVYFCDFDEHFIGLWFRDGDFLEVISLHSRVLDQNFHSRHNLIRFFFLTYPWLDKIYCNIGERQILTAFTIPLSSSVNNWYAFKSRDT